MKHFYLQIKVNKCTNKSGKMVCTNKNSTIIRQQHIKDRTEQERLFLSFTAQKYYKTKGSIQSGAMHIPCAG